LLRGFLDGNRPKCISEYWIEIIVDSSGNARYSIEVCRYQLEFSCIKIQVNRVETWKFTSASVLEAEVFVFLAKKQKHPYLVNHGNLMVL